MILNVASLCEMMMMMMSPSDMSEEMCFSCGGLCINSILSIQQRSEIE